MTEHPIPDQGRALLRTITTPTRAEIERVKGSRFVGDVAPASDEAAAFAFLETVRGQAPDATHHCWAYVLEDGRQRASDDGEPRDTAGAPILRHILGADLVDLVVVVTRWYGGTNLGRGGLVRAYGDAAAAALGAAEIVQRPAMSSFRLSHGYELTAAVETALAAHEASEVDAAYGVRVERTVAVPRADSDAFVRAVLEATAGRVRPEAT